MFTRTAWRVAFLAVAAGVCLPLTAQSNPNTDPLSPGVLSPIGNVPELGGPNLGSEVGSLKLVRNPAGGYLGSATVKRPGRTDWDPITFTWAGPGQNPVLDGTDGSQFTGALIGPGDEFACNISDDGLVMVADTGPGHPVGGGNAVLATRANTTSAFGNVKALQGVGSSYIDTQIGKIMGQTVLWWIDGPGNIHVSNLDVNPASANYGVAFNDRIAVAFDNVTFPGLNFWHSPSPVPAEGDADALIMSAFISPGSDGYHQSTPDQSQFTGGAVAAVKPRQLADSLSSWDANPASVQGSAIYAQAAGATYGAPLRIDYLGVNSAPIPSSGGTIHCNSRLPLSMPNSSLGFLNIGLPMAAPVTQATLQALFGGLGLTFAGGLSVNAIVAVPAPFTNGTLSVPLAIPAGGPGAGLNVEVIAFDASTGRVMISNRGTIGAGAVGCYGEAFGLDMLFAVDPNQLAGTRIFVTDTLAPVTGMLSGASRHGDVPPTMPVVAELRYRTTAGSPVVVTRSVLVDNASRRMSVGGTTVNYLRDIFGPVTGASPSGSLSLVAPFQIQVALVGCGVGVVAVNEEYHTDEGATIDKKVIMKAGSGHGTITVAQERDKLVNGIPGCPKALTAAQWDAIKDDRKGGDGTKTGDTTCKYDCHGLTFAGGKSWIDDCEVEAILRDNKYKKSLPRRRPLSATCASSGTHQEPSSIPKRSPPSTQRVCRRGRAASGVISVSTSTTSRFTSTRARRSSTGTPTVRWSTTTRTN